MSLTEFLSARIAEDWEQRVLRVRQGRRTPTLRELRETDRWAAECEAKWRIVNACIYDYADSLSAGDDVRNMATEVLLWTAHAYADHPDYDEKWRA